MSDVRGRDIVTLLVFRGEKISTIATKLKPKGANIQQLTRAKFSLSRGFTTKTNSETNKRI